MANGMFFVFVPYSSHANILYKSPQTHRMCNDPTQALQYNFKHPRYHLLPTLKGLEIQRYTRTEKIYRLPDTIPAVHLHVLLLFRPPQKTLCIESLNQLSFSNMN